MRLGAPRTSSGTRRPVLAAVLSALALVALAGCGEETAEPEATRATPSATASTTPGAEPSGSASADPDAPSCDEVWVEGARIPRGYTGCNSPSGFVAKDALSCSSGQYLARHDDRWFGVLGGKVRVAKSTLDDDDRYRASVAKCRG